MKYNVIKGFYDSQDTLKSEPKGRHYVPGDDQRGVYPATKRSIDDERLAFLQDEGFLSDKPIEE
ncbi:hypothetical protein [Dolosigranulum pigrum]|uniref:hypothetical protein n=1 Tax=Dolosigranulum pigrum TaxID=29394 RepID=UPI000DBF49F5|nr:hypothetical protein [Dolosigranulum pigrum]RAN60822.1 hypothetical protein B8A46_01110 [Dolosigranulum pigrum]DAL17098.1 MAG TPA_asm: hypothetical protein [Caudoviricetes sp.]